MLQGPGKPPVDGALVSDVSGPGTEGLSTIILVEGELPDILPFGLVTGVGNWLLGPEPDAAPA